MTLVPSSSMDDDSESDGEECMAPNLCIDAPPPGWSGPYAPHYAVAATAEPQQCSGNYDRQVLQAYKSIDSGNARCDCSCGGTSGVRCDQPFLLEIGGSGCDNFKLVDSRKISKVGDCWTSGRSLTNASVQSEQALPSEGSCSPVNATDKDKPTQIFPMRVCGGPNASPGCGDSEICMPRNDTEDGTLCIYSMGNKPCPDGDYRQRAVYYRGFSDQRTCSGCRCGDPQGECQGTLRGWQGATDCKLSEVTKTREIATGECNTPNLDAVTPIELIKMGFSGSCQASGGQVKDSVIPEDAVTVCCTL